MPFLAELIKLIATVAWTVARGRQGELFRGNSWQKWRVYAVLAFIYMLINNIVFLALLQLSPISFIALGNLKTVTTAIFFLLCLGRNLTKLQWHSLGLLTMGAMMTQVSGRLWDDLPRGKFADPSPFPLDRQIGRCEKVLASPPLGISWSLLSCGLSASAGVFTEMFLKREEEELHLQNFKVYACGTVVNFLRLAINHVVLPADQRTWWFNGFEQDTWLIPMNLALTGIMVSWVMRCCPIHLKIVANSSTLIASYFIQQALDPEMTNAHIFLGLMMISISIGLYYANPKLLSGDSDSDRADLRYWCGIVTPSMTRASTHPSMLAADSMKEKSYLEA